MSSVWLFKEYGFMLADLNMSVFTTLCCQVVASLVLGGVYRSASAALSLGADNAKNRRE